MRGDVASLIRVFEREQQVIRHINCIVSRKAVLSHGSSVALSFQRRSLERQVQC